jgi:hypothetical protein
MDAGEIIRMLDLAPLVPEGGFFRETYRSRRTCDGGGRSLSTAIYYLLTPDTASLVHRLPSTEIFHFYLGSPVTMLLLPPAGGSEVVTLGNDLAAGHRPQVVVPAGTWQGALLADPGPFALLGTTVAPGYDDRDLVIAERAELLASHPERRDLIERLTR